MLALMCLDNVDGLYPVYFCVAPIGEIVLLDLVK